MQAHYCFQKYNYSRSGGEKQASQVSFFVIRNSFCHILPDTGVLAIYTWTNISVRDHANAFKCVFPVGACKIYARISCKKDTEVVYNSRVSMHDPICTP